jgi:hypothetical protein
MAAYAWGADLAGYPRLLGLIYPPPTRLVNVEIHGFFYAGCPVWIESRTFELSLDLSARLTSLRDLAVPALSRRV